MDKFVGCYLWGARFFVCNVCVLTSSVPISLGDIRYVPLRWVLTLFLSFLHFWSDVPKFHSLACAYFLKSVRKGYFRNVWVKGGVSHF